MLSSMLKTGCRSSISSHSYRCFSSASAAATATESIKTPQWILSSMPSTIRARFDPKSILPSEYKRVRVISNTSRDAQQSNLSAEMAHIHRMEVSRRANNIYKNMNSPKGYEQTWGGTIPMFDTWKRGQQTFEAMREQSSYFPDTPQSALIRSNSLVSMSVLPPDIVDSFIKHAIISGVDVYTNFDAHNDWRNHKNVAEAVIKYGGHYQAAYSYAIFNRDPTIYNVKQIVQFFRECVAMGAHSLYLKDPSGVLSPEMSAAICAEVKSAFPHLPLVLHTHCQTGYAYMSYLQGVLNGANGVECSGGFSDGAGQPYSLTLLRAFEDLGMDTGNPDKKAMEEVAAYCRSLRPIYPQANLVRPVDISTETTGVPGGQRTILDKELIDAGQPHLIPKVDEMIGLVREEGGKLCQVTPVADAYAREAMRRLRGGHHDKGFAQGYGAILTGEWGAVDEPVNRSHQKIALIERGYRFVDRLRKNTDFPYASSITEQLLEKIKGIRIIEQIAEQMWPYIELVSNRRRLLVVQARIQQLLEIIKDDGEKLASLERKIKAANDIDPVTKKPIVSLSDRLTVLRREEDELKQYINKAGNRISEEDYEKLYRKLSPDSVYEKIIDNTKSGADFRALFPPTSELLLILAKEIVAGTCWISGESSATMISPMNQAKKFVDKLEKDYLLGLKENSVIYEEALLLYCVFHESIIPNLVKNMLMNYRENPDFWPPTYTVEKKKEDKKLEEIFLPRPVLNKVEEIIGLQTIDKLATLSDRIRYFSNRLKKLRDPNSYGYSRVGEQTKTAIADRIKELETEKLSTESIAHSKLDAAIKENPNLFSGDISVVNESGIIIRQPIPPKQQLASAINYLNELVKRALSKL